MKFWFFSKISAHLQHQQETCLLELQAICNWVINNFWSFGMQLLSSLSLSLLMLLLLLCFISKLLHSSATYAIGSWHFRAKVLRFFDVLNDNAVSVLLEILFCQQLLKYLDIRHMLQWLSMLILLGSLLLLAVIVDAECRLILTYCISFIIPAAIKVI